MTGASATLPMTHWPTGLLLLLFERFRQLAADLFTGDGSHDHVGRVEIGDLDPAATRQEFQTVPHLQRFGIDLTATGFWNDGRVTAFHIGHRQVLHRTVRVLYVLGRTRQLGPIEIGDNVAVGAARTTPDITHVEFGFVRFDDHPLRIARHVHRRQRTVGRP